MKVVGLALVKDEADIIEECLRHALTFCDLVCVLDNGSTDGSAAVIERLVTEFPDRFRSYGVTHQPFVVDMRRLMYDDLHTTLGWDDWIFVIDADELLLSDPRPALRRAAAAGHDRVSTWQAQFQFTEADLAAWETGIDRSLPVSERLRYFTVDWREDRFFRNRPDRVWEGQDLNMPTWVGSSPLWALVNRHYQYRDPEQIQTRLEHRAEYSIFVHEGSLDWHTKVMPTKGLRHWTPGEDIRPLPWRYYVAKARDRLPF